MTAAPKREWVFDGTRGEFWVFLIATAVYSAFLIRTVVRAFKGVVPKVHVDLTTWISLLTFVILIFAWRDFGRWFTVAFSVLTVETAVHLLLGYGKVSGRYALVVLVLLDYFSTLLLFIAFLSYLVKRLRREPLNHQTESDTG